MTDFINGKSYGAGSVGGSGISGGIMNFYEMENHDMISEPQEPYIASKKVLNFSDRAKEVFNTGRELWKYYHSQPNCNVNASFYDIREHFQGRDAKGRMKNTSDDERYNKLIADLRLAMKFLAKQIEPKIYEYGFLKE